MTNDAPSLEGCKLNHKETALRSYQHDCNEKTGGNKPGRGPGATATLTHTAHGFLETAGLP